MKPRRLHDIEIVVSVSPNRSIHGSMLYCPTFSNECRSKDQVTSKSQ